MKILRTLGVFVLFMMVIVNLKFPPTSPIENGIRLAVVGDYGDPGLPNFEVSRLINSWSPQAILTTGDNVYPGGNYLEYWVGVYPYYFRYIDSGRLFPSLGNHDWGYPWDAGHSVDSIPLLKTLTYLPGNGRYYRVVFGDNLVEAFIVDNDPREPSGITADSIQGQWLKRAMENSKAEYQLVFMHVPPYSSCFFGNNSTSAWPYKEWGAEAVFAGHCHFYERIMKDGMPYFINGLGGAQEITEFKEVTDGSVVRYIDNYGAQIIEATSEKMTISFVTVNNQVVDRFVILNPSRP